MSYFEDTAHQYSAFLGDLFHSFHILNQQHNLMCFHQQSRLEKVGRPPQTLDDILDFDQYEYSMMISLVQNKEFRLQTTPAPQSMLEFKLGDDILDNCQALIERIVALVNQPSAYSSLKQQSLLGYVNAHLLVVIEPSFVGQFHLTLRDDLKAMHRILINYELAASYFYTVTIHEIERCYKRRRARESDRLDRYLLTPRSQRRESLFHVLVGIDKEVYEDPTEKLRLEKLNKELDLGTHVLEVCEGMEEKLQSIIAHLEEALARAQEEEAEEGQDESEEEMSDVEETDPMERIRTWLGIEEHEGGAFGGEEDEEPSMADT
ncbi:hypothetical protein BDV93DRAFT_560521 [Ceratobasidium sp. AG-I]|nr:hypothetical protein BDV93DRAFT_560521 [Ceratobasidium sp. AG-I]